MECNMYGEIFLFKENMHINSRSSFINNKQFRNFKQITNKISPKV